MSRPPVLFYTSANAFRYDEKQQPQAEGRVGVAITAGRSFTTAQLMVYRGQQDYICTVDITPSFKYTVQEKNFAIFYGKDNRAWSIQFNNANDARSFTIHVALAKFFVSGQKNIVVIEEPATIAGQHNLAAGDTAGIKYTTWITKPDTGACSTQVDSNATKDGVSRLVIGDRSSSFPAWHAALTGQKKGFKAIVISPPAMAFGAAGVAGTIPPNTIVVFELEISKVKRAAAPAAEAPAPTLNAPASLFEGFPAGDAVTTAEAQKTELLQRLARVGAKPTLGSPQITAQPLPQAAAQAQAQPQPQPQQQVQPQPQPVQPQVSQPNQPGYYPGTMAVYNPQQAQQQPQMAPMYQQPQVPPASIQQQSYDATGSLLARGAMSTADALKYMMEDREFRNEMKASMSQFQAKLDDLTRKVDEFRVPPGRGESGSASGLVIIQTLQRLVDDCERSRTQLRERDMTIDTLRRKVQELNDKSTRFVEENTRMMSTRDENMKHTVEELRSQIAAIQTEKARTEVALSDAIAKSAKQQAEVLAAGKTVEDLQAELRATRDNVAKLTADLAEAKELKTRADEKCSRAVEKAQEETETRKELDERIEELKKKLEEQREAVASTEKLAAAQKARCANEMKQAEKEHEDEREALQSQIAKLNKQIVRLQESMPNADEIEKDADRKWKRKADSMVEQAKSAVEDEYAKKLRDAEKRIKLLRAEKDEAEERLHAIESRKGISAEEMQRKLDDAREEAQETVSNTVIDSMNAVFKSVKGLVSPKEQYQGRSFVTLLRNAIKAATVASLHLDEDVPALSISPVAPIVVEAAADVKRESVPAPAPALAPAPVEVEEPKKEEEKPAEEPKEEEKPAEEPKKEEEEPVEEPKKEEEKPVEEPKKEENALFSDDDEPKKEEEKDPLFADDEAEPKKEEVLPPVIPEEPKKEKDPLFGDDDEEPKKEEVVPPVIPEQPKEKDPLFADDEAEPKKEEVLPPVIPEEPKEKDPLFGDEEEEPKKEKDPLFGDEEPEPKKEDVPPVIPEEPKEKDPLFGDDEPEPKKEEIVPPVIPEEPKKEKDPLFGDDEEEEPKKEEVVPPVIPEEPKEKDPLFGDDEPEPKKEEIVPPVIPEEPKKEKDPLFGDDEEEPKKEEVVPPAIPEEPKKEKDPLFGDDEEEEPKKEEVVPPVIPEEPKKEKDPLFGDEEEPKKEEKPLFSDDEEEEPKKEEVVPPAIPDEPKKEKDPLFGDDEEEPKKEEVVPPVIPEEPKKEKDPLFDDEEEPKKEEKPLFSDGEDESKVPPPVSDEAAASAVAPAAEAKPAEEAKPVEEAKPAPEPATPKKSDPLFDDEDDDRPEPPSLNSPPKTESVIDSALSSAPAPVPIPTSSPSKAPLFDDDDWDKDDDAGKDDGNDMFSGSKAEADEDPLGSSSMF